MALSKELIKMRSSGMIDTIRKTRKTRTNRPSKAINPRGEPVPKRAMAEFEKTVALELAYLKGEKNLSEYAVDSVVPDAPVAPVAAPEKPVDKVKSKPVKKNRR